MGPAVLKVGGSLGERGDPFPLLAEAARLVQDHPILVVPGGGPFAEAVREQDRRWGLSPDASHRMALLAMDQYGLLLADRTPGAVAVESVPAAQAAWSAGRLPVLLPAALTWLADGVERSWRATSDAVAAWVAGLVHSPLLVLAKDVDGACAGDPRAGPAALLPQVRARDLAALGVVDPCCADLIPPGCRCWIINGRRPERLAELVQTGKTVGTEVLTDA